MGSLSRSKKYASSLIHNVRGQVGVGASYGHYIYILWEHVMCLLVWVILNEPVHGPIRTLAINAGVDATTYGYVMNAWDFWPAVIVFSAVFRFMSISGAGETYAR